VEGIVLKKQRGQPTGGGSQAWGLGMVLTTPHCKIKSGYEMFTLKASDRCTNNLV